MNECDSCIEKAKYELNGNVFYLPCLVNELDQTGIGSTTDLAILFAVQEDEEEYQELIISTINDINKEYDVEIKILEDEDD